MCFATTREKLQSALLNQCDIILVLLDFGKSAETTQRPSTHYFGLVEIIIELTRDQGTIKINFQYHHSRLDMFHKQYRKD